MSKLVPMQKELTLSAQARPGVRSRAYIIAALVLLQLMLVGCAGPKVKSEMVLTPVVATPTGIHHPGKFIWDDLLTTDVKTAKNFYGGLFGWTFEQLGSYTIIINQNRQIGGIVRIGVSDKVTGAARWISSLSVTDVKEAAALITSEGGQVHAGPLEQLNRGDAVLASDPQGAQLLLLRSKDGDPEDNTNPAFGSWLWHELWSNDPEAALVFYQKLLGYDYEGEKDDYLILLNEGQWRAGIRYVAKPDVETRWVPVVRVADTEDTSKRAQQLGGKLLVGPLLTTNNNSVALLSDPSGALIIVQRWQATTYKQEE